MAKAKQTKGDAAVATVEEAGLLDGILDQMPKTIERDRGQDMVQTLLRGVADKSVTYDRSLAATIDDAISRIDADMSKQVAAILHNEEFQKLEGSWRGLHHLVKNTRTGQDMQVRVMNATKRELHRDLTRAIDFDQSAIWRKVYSDAIGTPGGAPFGSLVGDYEFTNDNMDIELLSKISGVAAASMAPFLSAVGPGMFGLDSYTELEQVYDLATTFSDDVIYSKWNSFRDSEDSRYVVLTCPRVLAREPYGSSNQRIDEFGFEEFPIGADGMRSDESGHEQYCWTNAAYALAGRLTDAFDRSGFCTAIRGYENGGRVEDLPIHTYRTADGDYANKCPTEVLIPETREHEMSNLGFLPLCNYKNTDYAVFFGSQTTNRPKNFGKKDFAAKENAAISARLPYMMAASRIGHYLKCIGRDKIGDFAERKDLESFLRKWISNYVSDSGSMTRKEKAEYPLQAAQIDVESVPGEPGAYKAVAQLRPWLQMEKLTASLRMVAEIPNNKG